MTNIRQLFPKRTVEETLEHAKTAEFSEVIVIGYGADGNLIFFASEMSKANGVVLTRLVERSLLRQIEGD